MSTAEEMFSLRFTQPKGMATFLANTSAGGEDGMMLWLYLNNKDEALAGDLADALSLTSGRIANILKQLEAKNYVTRKTGREDRRKVFVALTPEGREHSAQVYNDTLSKYQSVVDAIGENDAKEFLRIGKEILETIS